MFRRRPRRPGPRSALIAVAAAVVACTFAVVDPFAAGAQHTRPAAGSRRSTPATRASAGARTAAADARAADAVDARFALLRRAPGSPPPANLLRDLTHVPASYGLVASMARQASDGTWLIPGAEGTCMAVTDAEGIGLSCAPNPAADNGELRFEIVDQGSGDQRILGVTPDGRSSVTAYRSDGTALATAHVTENTYDLGVRNAARLKVE